MDAELEALRGEEHGAQKVWWSEQLQHIRALQGPPPQRRRKRGVHRTTSPWRIAEAAFAYKMEGDPKYLGGSKALYGCGCEL
jgi:hypothetical protein